MNFRVESRGASVELDTRPSPRFGLWESAALHQFDEFVVGPWRGTSIWVLDPYTGLKGESVRVSSITEGYVTFHPPLWLDPCLAVRCGPEAVHA